MELLFILGRNPALSSAEIARVFPLPQRVLADAGAVLVSMPEQMPEDAVARFRRLGGSLKIGAVIGSTGRADFSQMLGAAVEGCVASTAGQKIHLGASVYGPSSGADRLSTTARSILLRQKNMLKERGQSVRVVTGKERALSSVIVAKNHLLNRGREFLVVQDGETIILAWTLAVQDFEGQSDRDYGRPRRDPRRGMLPLQLARIMVNLALPNIGGTLLDPFCGIGTILQEALLLEHEVIGSDIDPRAIGDTRANLEWILDQSLRGAVRRSNPVLMCTDVRALPQKLHGKPIDAIVTEAPLGPPIRGPLTAADVKEIRGKLLPLYQDAFRVFAQLLRPGGRLVLALPVWRVGSQLLFAFSELTVLASSGFEIKKVPAGVAGTTTRGTFLYGRPDQHVWREIVVCERR